MRHLLLVVVALSALPVSASPNDINLLGIANGDAAQQAADFKAMTTELGLVLTPSALQPAETTGQAGFDFALDYTFHDISDQERYWQKAVEGNREGRNLLPILQTLGLRGRKGFILPVPLTSEVELGATWILDSHLVNLGGNVRLALNEGFRWIPDIAVMAGINRMIGSTDLDLVTVTAGGSVSKGFGIMGSWNLCPFVSYQRIFINAASRVLDPDPRSTADVGNNTVFPEVSLLDNQYDRISLGARVNVAIVQVTGGVDVNLIPDDAGQRRVFMQYGIRAGLLF